MKDDRKKTPEVSANCRNLGDFYKLYFASQSEIYLAISEIAVGGDICLRQVLCKTVGDDALGVPKNGVILPAAVVFCFAKLYCYRSYILLRKVVLTCGKFFTAVGDDALASRKACI